MRVIIQRVLNASVSVKGKTISQIGKGLLVLVGITNGDTVQDADYCVRKILGLRLWDDEKNNKPWAKSVVDMKYEVLCVSQFTLHVYLKGNHCDYSAAMKSKEAKPFYESILQMLRTSYSVDTIKDGEFGADMQVSLVNDGPVTVPIDTKSYEGLQFQPLKADRSVSKKNTASSSSSSSSSSSASSSSAISECSDPSSSSAASSSAAQTSQNRPKKDKSAAKPKSKTKPEKTRSEQKAPTNATTKLDSEKSTLSAEKSKETDDVLKVSSKS
eukprot:TRINITY_DN176_c0_g1_i1.p1 TRINITY_DN176_c0_g1~~TRINITY_DN176_c0_g1_i1.p1  ORF type:complete len:271 (+),score=68.43 TRINITY_DN176_c0_g1_i1:33-845(+)